MGRLPTEAACPNAFKACWRIGSGSRSPRWANSMIFFATRYVRGEGPGLPAMTMLIEFFRVRSTDDSHATLDRISVAADNLEAAKMKAKSLFETLNMPQKPDGLRILVQEERELFVWSRGDDA